MVQDATKKETLRIAIGTAIGIVLMIAVFFVLHKLIPEQVPFDYKVIVGGLLGGFVAVLNFFLMGLTVQKVVAEQDQKLAYQKMKTSYTYRNLMQIIWIILALVLPFTNGIAGIVPLFFPSVVVKLYYIFLNPEKDTIPSAHEDVSEEASPGEAAEAERREE